MDSSMLFEAAHEGKLELLAMLLQENPLILADIRLTSLSESVLHVATKSGQLNFVRELMKIDPHFAREMNKDGFRPLDTAAIMENLGIVKTLLGFDRDLSRLTGRGNRSALHYAAVKLRVEIIDELFSTCPDCLEDITFHGGTAIQLSVKYCQFDAFTVLVKWLERLSKESIINIRDGDGNTVLHLAVLTKQYECLNLLLDENCFTRRTIEFNVPNRKGLTALDISDMVAQDSYDAKARETLQCLGAVRAQYPIAAEHSPQTETNPQPPIRQHDHRQSEAAASRNWLEYFKFQRQRDSPSDTRNALLVVAALITTVTFQASINPPSGLFDESRRLNSTDQPSHRQPIGVAFRSDFMFVFFNSLGFITSSIIISYLTSGFPFYRELFTSLGSMFITYSAAIDINVAGTKAERKIQAMAWYTQLIALILPHFLRRPPWLRKRSWGCWRRESARDTGLPIEN